MGNAVKCGAVSDRCKHRGYAPQGNAIFCPGLGAEGNRQLLSGKINIRADDRRFQTVKVFQKPYTGSAMYSRDFKSCPYERRRPEIDELVCYLRVVQALIGVCILWKGRKISGSLLQFIISAQVIVAQDLVNCFAAEAAKLMIVCPVGIGRNVTRLPAMITTQEYG